MKSAATAQLRLYRFYVTLRYILAVCNLINAAMKIPTMYEMIMLATGIAQAKTPDSQPDDKPKSFGVIFSVLFVYVGFFSLIVHQLVLAFFTIKRRYGQYLTYIILMGIYLAFIATAYLIDVDNTEMPLGLALFLTKYTLFGWYLLDSPDFWYYTLLKVSIIFDTILYPFGVTFYILVTKYDEYTVNGKAFMERVYNLVDDNGDVKQEQKQQQEDVTC